MDSEYNVATLPWAVLLSAGILFFAWRSYQADEYRTAIRRLGWALVPWAVWLIGLMRLVVKIGSALTDWATGFVFRPSVWLGLVVGVIAVGLIVAGSIGRPRKERIPRSERPPGRRALSRTAKPAAKAPAVDDDLADVEEILRKHGIQ